MASSSTRYTKAEPPQSVSPMSPSSHPAASSYGMAAYAPVYQHASAYTPFPHPEERFAPHSTTAQHRPAYVSHTYDHPAPTRPPLATHISSPDVGAFAHDRPGSSFSNASHPQSPYLSDGHYEPRPPLTKMPSQTGPIKATAAIIPRRDPDGIPWISVEYTKDRAVQSHRIRIDTETVNLDKLSYEFKLANVVYPAVFKGIRRSRDAYEMECNRTAWALAALNEILQTSKGLRQRAVDHWRNCNPDRSKASRRVRRDAKKARRNVMASLPTQTPAPYTGHVAVPSSYAPLNNGSDPANGVITPVDGKSHDRSFPSPVMPSRTGPLPPTPETLGNDSHSDTSHGHMTSSSSYSTQDQQYQPPCLPSQNGPLNNERRGSAHYHMNVVMDGVQKGHMSGAPSERATVFPRAKLELRDHASYDNDGATCATRTHVRIGLAPLFDQTIDVPGTSAAQQERDMYWNDQAYDLIKTRYPELRARPQTVQRVLTRLHRRGNRRFSGAGSSVWRVQNRPGMHA